jgi:Ni/Fe-hydrogenase 1 B-type cytochrome subunit
MSKTLSYSIPTPLTGDPDRFVRVYVWELPVRLTHWVMVITLIVLSITGTYMHHPFLTSASPLAWTMGLMRSIHFGTAFLFTCSFLLRLNWFFSGNRWASWRQFIPLAANRRRGMLEMIRYYGFMRRTPPTAVGHNGLAGFAYCIIWAACITEILTGFALLDNFLGTSPTMHFLFGWLPRLIDLQWLRGLHFFTMFVFWFFFIHHIYSALVVSSEEKNGVMESIFSGYKFLRVKELRHEQSVEREERG